MKTQKSLKPILSILTVCIITGLISAPAAHAQAEEGSMILSSLEFTIKAGSEMTN